MVNDYDTTEKVERTDTGYRLTVESTRGTGTRDQDKVKLEARTEEPPARRDIDLLCGTVEEVMNRRREHTPDEEEE